MLTLPSLKAVHGGDSRNGRRLQRAPGVLLLAPFHVLILCRTLLHPAFHVWFDPAFSWRAKASPHHWSRLRIIPEGLCMPDVCGIGSTRPFRSCLGLRRCRTLGRLTTSTSCGPSLSPNIPPRNFSCGSLQVAAMSRLWTRNYLGVAQGRRELMMQCTPYIGVSHKNASVSRHLGYLFSRVCMPVLLLESVRRIWEGIELSCQHGTACARSRRKHAMMLGNIAYVWEPEVGV